MYFFSPHPLHLSSTDQKGYVRRSAIVFFEKISVFYSNWPKYCFWWTLGHVSNIFCKCHRHDTSKEVVWPKVPFWVNTHQVAQSSSKYLAKYNIFFNGIDIQRNYANINATCPNYFFLNENRLLQKINPSNLAPLLKYFDTLEND